MITPSQLSDHISRFLNRLIFLERKSVFTFKGLSLYPSEIHLMQLIKSGTASGATLMADKLGITKGAVSQTLTRLVKKNILTKAKDLSHKNELLIEFTPLGKDALEAFEHTRKETGKKYSAYLSGITQTERKTLEHFLHQMEKFLPQ